MWNHREAARRLNISYKSLLYRIKMAKTRREPFFESTPLGKLAVRAFQPTRAVFFAELKGK